VISVRAKRVKAGCGVALAAAMAAAGCTPRDVAGPHNVVTTTDLRRRDAMLTEPVLKLAITRPDVHAGERVAQTQWNRGRIEAYLVKDQDPVPDRRPEDVASKIREALRIMRAGGWLTLYSECDPPVHFVVGTNGEKAPSPSPTASPQAGAGLGEHTWSWKLYLYRIRDGVSYWAQIDGTVAKNGDGSTAGLWIDLVAPQEHDPADLFADRPRPLADTAICVQREKSPRAPEMDGRPIVVLSGIVQSTLTQLRRTPGQPRR
jgi:hypothetical protein